MTWAKQSTLFENKSSWDLERKKCVSLSLWSTIMMFSMCSLSVFENVNISLSYICMYKFSYKILECGWSITVSHLYDTALECAKHSSKRSFIHVFRLNASLFISLGHVQFGPEMSSCYIVTNSALLRERSHILPCVVILLSQIEYNAQCTILLWNTQHRHSLFISCGDPPRCSVLLNFQASSGKNATGHLGSLCLSCFGSSIKGISWRTSWDGSNSNGSGPNRSLNNLAISSWNEEYLKVYTHS